MRGRKHFPAIAHAIVFFIIIYGIQPGKLQAQSYGLPFLLNSRIIERFREHHGDRENLDEELSQYLEDLTKRPIRINTIQSESAERLILLSDFQIFAIRNYLANHGPILSCAELSLVNGFDYTFAQGISPFIDFSVHKDFSTFREAFRNKRCTHRLAVRSTWKIDIDNFRAIRPDNLNRDELTLHSRYDLEWGEHLSASITYEKDAGERFLARRGKILEPEMLVYSLSLRHLQIGKRLYLKQLITGDFNVTFGQGICISGANALFRGTDPSGSGRKPDVFHACKHENGRLSGIGGSLLYRTDRYEFLFSTFCSRKRLDAHIENDCYTSLPSGGLHDSRSSLENRRRIFLFSCGNGLTMKRRNLEIGIHHILYRYSRKNGIIPQYWNRYRLFEGWWGNVGTDFTYSHGPVRLFGEIAVDFTPALSGIAGCTVFPSERTTLAVIYRGFGIRYKSPLAVNTGFNATPDNEQSLEFLTDINLNYRWRIHIAARGAFHPYSRYGIQRPSMQGQLYLQLLRSEERWNIDAGCSTRFRSYHHPLQIRFRTSGNLFLSRFHLKAQAGIHIDPFSRSRPGTYLSLESTWQKEWMKQRTSIAATIGTTAFDSIEWETRNYVYEKDLLHSFSSVLLYGTGIRGYLLLGFKSRHTETRIKAGCEVKDRLKRIRPMIKLQLILKL